MTPTQKTIIFMSLAASCTTSEVKGNYHLDSSARRIYTCSKDVTKPTKSLHHNSFSKDKIISNKKKLKRYKSFSENWDGFNSLPINENVIKNVENFISELEYQPKIFPLSEGGVQVEMEFSDDLLYEIEFYEKKIIAFIVNEGEEYEGEIDFKELLSLLRNFENHAFA